MNAFCNPNPCSDVLGIEHYSAADNCAGTASDASCTPECDSGWTSSGDVSCSLGNWTDPGVTCDPDPCLADPPIAHLNGTSSSCEDTLSGATCSFNCNAGFTPSSSATCTTGSWDVRTCDESCQTEPDAFSGSGSTDCSNTVHGGSCAVNCTGTLLATPTNFTCSHSVWSNATCTVVPAAATDETVIIVVASVAGVAGVAAFAGIGYAITAVKPNPNVIPGQFSKHPMDVPVQHTEYL